MLIYETTKYPLIKFEVRESTRPLTTASLYRTGAC